MGTGSFDDQNDGEIADAVDVQQLIDALKGDVVPRNSSGIATQGAGSLGTSALPWLKLILGALGSHGLSIEGDGEDLIVKVNQLERLRFDRSAGEILFKPDGGATRATIASTGITGTFPDSGVLSQMKRQTFTGSGTFTAPNDVNSVILFGCGGGGGGGGGAGGNFATPRGGQGGNGSAFKMYIYNVTPGNDYAVTIGAGGAGGAGGLASQSGNDGANGSNTVFDSTVVFGGAAGGKSGGSGTTNPGGVSILSRQTTGGAGGEQSTSTASVGGNSETHSGGLVNGVNGGGGGGGAGSAGNGGAGGAFTGGAGGSGLGPGVNTGGGGGGGAVGASASGGGTGGTGGSGSLRIYYISHL